MTLRNNNAYETLIYGFTNEVYVVCPNCKKRAVVTAQKLYDDKVKLVCTHCGYNKTPHQNIVRISNSLDNKLARGSVMVISAGIDPYFYQPVWLSQNVGEHTLWAYNYNHLNFLKDFVSAKLRERDIDKMSNKSLGSRLPKWLTSHKNRDSILKAIDKLLSK